MCVPLQARHTGIKIVQQIAILMGCAILPHLRALVEIIEHGLVDEQQKVCSNISPVVSFNVFCSNFLPICIFHYISTCLDIR